MTENFEKPEYDGIRFYNPKSFIGWTGLPSFLRILKWTFIDENQSTIPSKEVLDETLPVQKPSFDLTSKFSATWLGHATVFVNVSGVSFITDPVWSGRCSPLQKFGLGPLRYRQPPCLLEDMPALNFGLISHNHYDHLDSDAVLQLSQRFPDMQWIVPKGLKEWMTATTVGNAIHELSWGENAVLRFNDKEFQVWCVPAQHWSQRSIFDRNKTLWSGWVVCGCDKKFYYAGDTGFCHDEFVKLGNKFGPFDLSVLPIGCYKPKDFMRSQHIDPDDAAEIHVLTKSKKSLGVHWGTYKMGSHEFYLEPPSKLFEALEKRGLSTNDFFTLHHGSTWSVEKPLPADANRWATLADCHET